jgi:hypothetical protein
MTTRVPGGGLAVQLVGHHARDRGGVGVLQRHPRLARGVGETVVAQGELPVVTGLGHPVGVGLGAVRLVLGWLGTARLDPAR